jgi:thioredoxin 1
MADGITYLTTDTFDEQIGGADGPVLVDFWAEWCGPCKMIAPILEELAGELDGQVSIAKLNVDDSPDIARRFEVMSIPTLIVFNDGAPAKRMVGAKGKAALLDDLGEFIS